MEHCDVVFEPVDWVWISGEYNSGSTCNVADFLSLVTSSDLRSNPFEEEENDTIMTGNGSRKLEDEVRDERAETEEGACRSARKVGEATKTSN